MCRLGQSLGCKTFLNSGYFHYTSLDEASVAWSHTRYDYAPSPWTRFLPRSVGGSCLPPTTTSIPPCLYHLSLPAHPVAGPIKTVPKFTIIVSKQVLRRCRLYTLTPSPRWR